MIASVFEVLWEITKVFFGITLMLVGLIALGTGVALVWICYRVLGEERAKAKVMRARERIRGLRAGDN